MYLTREQGSLNTRTKNNSIMSMSKGQLQSQIATQKSRDAMPLKNIWIINFGNQSYEGNSPQKNDKDFRERHKGWSIYLFMICFTLIMCYELWAPAWKERRVTQKFDQRKCVI